MKVNRMIGFVGVWSFFMGFVGWGRTQTSISQWGMSPGIQCVWPKWDTKIEKDTLRFQWKGINIPNNKN